MAAKPTISPEFDRFRTLVDRVLSVPKTELQRRIAEHKRESDANPNKRGPKRKAVTPSASPDPAASH